ncbi:MAG: tRNA preQ1(34) S-adenosylmethionine ribosyltransferase-isomerase QueA [Chloroflexaceae bacterium]|nr:tRNA preQ1(34) S-adenosylmethionine ribosyltransferase-isomerase QueA [Chloroflexaceae bacterium]
MSDDFRLSSYDYTLPEELIAQTPAVPRDSSRLLVVDSPSTHHHCRFWDLPRWLKPGDLLVLNNTRVIPARLYGRKPTGAAVEVLLLEPLGEATWLALVKPGKHFRPGSEIWFAARDRPQEFLKATVIGHDSATGGRILQFQVAPATDFASLLPRFGQIPFPPYVDPATPAQPSQYQTIYAQHPGAIAAPTAGLHFTEPLLNTLKTQGIELAYLTLHVGIGTFRPLENETITTHQMHQEWLEVSAATAAQINAAKARGGRVIAVGTTVVRALESAAQQTSEAKLLPLEGKTNLFIYPGYQWRAIDGLITNFHLPRSSLLLLVSALISRERLFSLYQAAIRERYRFYSFGDAMLILPAATLQGTRTNLSV